MKATKDVTAIVMDYGYFVSLADKLSETFKKVYYHTPIDREFVDVKDCVFGDGLDNVERCDDPLSPGYFDEIDLWIFPDIGFSSLQHHLKASGKAVWGSFDASDLELYRTQFLETLKSLNLPTPKYVVKTGLPGLTEHLKTVENKWIKINRYRAVMETFHHIDYDHSRRELENLAHSLGGAQDHVVFVVQDDIKTDIEIGYDGWTVLGQFPDSTYAGYEKKDELYLGSVRKYSELPEEVRRINKAFAPLFKKFGYQNFMATEIRVKGEPFFIDPTFRMPGQTGEQLLETCTNLGDVIWFGANGKIKQPEFKYQFAVSATLHYDTGEACDWKNVNVPKKARQWAKLAHYTIIDDMYHFPPGGNKELGVVIGVGDTITKALGHLKGNLDMLDGEPVSYKLTGFFDLLDSIREAEKQGMKFSDKPLPSKEEVLKQVAL